MKQYDSERALEDLRHAAFKYLGPVGYRMVRTEIQNFINYEVKYALQDAYETAKIESGREQIKIADQSSRNVLEGVLAGVEIGKKIDA